MKQENFDHGFPERAWEAARAEARQTMIAVAARRRVIAYSDLVAVPLASWKTSQASERDLTV